MFTWMFAPVSLLLLILLVAPAAATPKAGTRELRIGQAFQPPIDITDGLIASRPEGQDRLTGLGLGAGLGYFLSDHIEVGASASFQLLLVSEFNGSGSDTLSGPGFTAFTRFMLVRGRLAFYLEPAADLRALRTRNTARTSLALGGDLGVEFFVTDNWAVRLAPTYRYTIWAAAPTRAFGVVSDEGTHSVGVTWGLAAYF